VRWANLRWQALLVYLIGTCLTCKIRSSPTETSTPVEDHDEALLG
jgi:hypothetical protein